MFGWLKRWAAPEVEKRSSGAGYTAQVMAARENWISGNLTVAELTAAVQSCVSLWEGAFTLADVKGTDLLDRQTMALIGRGLALRGEAVFLIRDRLIPFTDWDLTTRDGIPRAYRGQVPEVGGGRMETALAAEVLHLRIASDAFTPWAGKSPLSRVPLSASLLAEVETALRDVYRDAPLGSQIVPVPDGSADDMATLRGSFKGRRGAALVIEGLAQSVGAGMHPQLGKSPDQLSPDLSKSMTGESLTAARDAVSLAFGVLPAMMNRSVTGPAVREAQRHLAQIVLQPLAQIVAEEAGAKLGGRVLIDVVRPMQAFDAGGKARALSTMITALAAAKEAGIDGTTLQDALAFIDWHDE
ncbi:hypothetical protein [Szabonella alba]|uniref:Phage portal protein n=1 Tax=Szabonella alba TaxID=2804194 RepID=A0A8K0VEC1_9RHOB|nr:hypothetical protein [Szabonella alba]MBL4917757.1 hypothetical protein [Szabonella alba]